MNNPIIDNNLLKGVFWLILMGITAASIVPTYSKQFIKLINKNDIIKHICIIWAIYFLIDFTDDKYAHPLNTLKQSLFIWIGYIVISKQPLYFNIFNFILITSIYTINSYNNFLLYNKYKDNKDKDVNKIKNLYKLSNILVIILIITSFTGLIHFYKYEKNYKQSKFNNAKFIFGSKI